MSKDRLLVFAGCNVLIKSFFVALNASKAVAVMAANRQVDFLFSRRKRNAFRQVGYQLKPAHLVCGLQLADFYAGTVRKMFIDGLHGVESHLSSPYDHVRHQISLEDFIDIE